MCETCEQKTVMMTVGTIDRANWGWGYGSDIKLTLEQAEMDPVRLGVFLDRGYLRLAPLFDCNCLEAGEKFKINFCPSCGKKLEVEK